MDISKYIDHTILKPEATKAQVEALCKEALENKFAAVCVNPVYTKLAAGILKGSQVGIATVVGFPLGATTAAEKVFEAKDSIANGATEIDMVMAVGLFKSGDFDAVKKDIAEVVKAAGAHPVKVILETSLLSNDEIIRACKLAVEAGAAFVKTSTGFNSRGASIEDIKIMKAAVGGKCRIKASGGIKTREQALSMIEAGAERIGTSSGVAIVKG